MKKFGCKLLAGASLAGDQNRAIGGRDPSEAFSNEPHGFAFPEHRMGVVVRLEIDLFGWTISKASLKCAPEFILAPGVLQIVTNSGS
jgi:hypothetical protein